MEGEEGGGSIFTTGLGNTGLQALGEKMVLITDLCLSPYSLSASPSLSLCISDAVARFQFRQRHISFAVLSGFCWRRVQGFWLHDLGQI